MLKVTGLLCLLLLWGCTGRDDASEPSVVDENPVIDENPVVDENPVTPEPDPDPVLGFPGQLTEAINELRAQARTCGNQTLAATLPVSWDDRLALAAERHSTDMATHNFFSHTGSDGLSVAHRVSLQGYSWSRLGENIAAGTITIDATLTLWLDSPGHCVNLMSPLFTQIGAAQVEASEAADFPVYWTLVMADPI